MRRVHLFRFGVASLFGPRRLDVPSRLCRIISSSNKVNTSGEKLKDEGHQSGQAVATDDNGGFRFAHPEFDNTRLIYASKSTIELIRAYIVFSACSLDLLVNNHAKVGYVLYTYVVVGWFWLT